jgi:hypothetical protein
LLTRPRAPRSLASAGRRAARTTRRLRARGRRSAHERGLDHAQRVGRRGLRDLLRRDLSPALAADRPGRAHRRSPRRWPAEPRRVHARARARRAPLHARVPLRPGRAHRGVAHARQLQHRAPRRGAIHAAVDARVPDALRARHRSSDRRCPDRARARSPRGIASRVGVSRASPSALLIFTVRTASGRARAMRDSRTSRERRFLAQTSPTLSCKS